MTAEVWVHNNLNVVDDLGAMAIDWGNGVFTPVEAFIVMFGSVIEDALASSSDVRQAIRDADDGRGFAALI